MDTDASGTDSDGSTTVVSDSSSGVDTSDQTTSPTSDPSGPTTADDTTATDATTGADTGDTGTPGCVDNSGCDGVTAFCSAGQCVACSDLPDPDLACATETPDTPHCLDTVGCVQCTDSRTDACDGATPICDTNAFECTGCSYHSQCATACNLDTGECMPDTPAVWVRPQAGNCSFNAAGTFDSPFCTLTEAVAYINEDQDGIGTIWLDDQGSPHEGVALSEGTIAIIGPDDEVRPQIDSGGLAVSGANTRVYVNNVLFGGDILDIVRVEDDASVWLDRTEIIGNIGQAVDIRSGAEVHLRNSMVVGNGRNSNLRAPIYLDGGELHMIYATVSDNAANNDTGAVDSIQCDGTNTVEVRNSIVIARDGSSISCPDIAIDNSFIDTNGLGGNGNQVQTLIGTDVLDWFVNPSGFPPGTYIDQDYHLSADGAALFDGIGLVAAGDPPFDIDLDPRPELGAATMPGADVP